MKALSAGAVGNDMALTSPAPAEKPEKVAGEQKGRWTQAPRGLACACAGSEEGEGRCLSALGLHFTPQVANASNTKGKAWEERYGSRLRHRMVP